MGWLFKHAYGRITLLKVEFCHICTGIAWLFFQVLVDSSLSVPSILLCRHLKAPLAGSEEDKVWEQL